MKQLILSLSILLVLSGCTTKTVYVDRPIEVKVPVQCVVELPKKPEIGINQSETQLNLQEWVVLTIKATERCTK